MAGGKTYYLRVTVEDEAGNSTTSDYAGRYCWALYGVTATSYVVAGSEMIGSDLISVGVAYCTLSKYNNGKTIDSGDVCFSSWNTIANDNANLGFKFSGLMYTPYTNPSKATGSFLPAVNNNGNIQVSSNCDFSEYYFLITEETSWNDSSTGGYVCVYHSGYEFYGKVYKVSTVASGYKNSGTFYKYIYSTNSSAYKTDTYRTV